MAGEGFVIVKLKAAPLYSLRGITMSVRFKNPPEIPITLPICVAIANRILHDLNFRELVSNLVELTPFHWAPYGVNFQNI